MKRKGLKLTIALSMLLGIGLCTGAIVSDSHITNEPVMALAEEPVESEVLQTITFKDETMEITIHLRKDNTAKYTIAYSDGTNDAGVTTYERQLDGTIKIYTSDGVDYFVLSVDENGVFTLVEVVEPNIPPKTVYTFGDESGTGKITLTTATEFSMEFTKADGTATITMAGTYELVDNKLTLHMPGDENWCFEITEGNVLVPIVPEEPVTPPVEPETDHEEHKFKDFVYTYLVPLFSGVSIVAVLQALVSFVISFLAKRALKKAIKAVDELKETNAMVVSNLKVLAENTIRANGLNAESQELFSNAGNELLAKLNSTEGKLENLAKMKEALVIFTTICGKIASHNTDLVNTGVAEDIQHLVETVKEI